MASEIKLQALKENVDTVEVNAVKVSAGEVVAKDQAALEVPSPMSGRVTKVLVKPGDQIAIGQVYCLIDGSNGEPAAAPAAKAESAAARTPEPAPPVKKEAPARPAATVPPLHKPQQPIIDRPSPAPPPAEERIVPAGPATR